MKKFFKMLVSCVALFSLTACGGIFVADYDNYKEDLAGKVVECLNVTDDPTTEEDESLYSVDASRAVLTTVTPEYHEETGEIVGKTRDTLNFKKGDGLVLKTEHLDLTQENAEYQMTEHIILDVYEDVAREVLLEAEFTGSDVDVYISNCYQYSVELQAYVQTVVDETTVIVVNNGGHEDLVDIIGDFYTIYEMAYNVFLPGFYDDILVFADINNLTYAQFRSYSYGVGGVYKNLKYTSDDGEYVIETELSTFDSLSLDVVTNSFKKNYYFITKADVRDVVTGKVLVSLDFDVKRNNSDNSIHAPENIYQGE